MAEKVTFDHYEVLTRDDGSVYELGRGAMGITYRAFDTNLECDVALKVISGSFLHTQGSRERFVSEARAAAKLRHPNVASVFHLGLEGDSYFYAMEFIDGETVEERVRTRGPLDPLLALRITGQVARALNAAEKHSLVHRDIKPSNLMLVQEDDEIAVKVIDFGLAKVTDSDAAGGGAATTIAGFVGTPYFSSPEQLQEKPLDSRSDIYSLGMTLWFMLCGKAPFTGTLAQVMTSHLMAEPPLGELSGLPECVTALVRRMVEKDPGKRQQSPLDLRREVDGAIELLGPGVATLPGETDAESMETVADFGVESEAGLAARYEMLEDLGEGEIGGMQRARDRDSGEIVRLIVMNPALVEDAEGYTRLEREVEKVQAASHPNLLRVTSLEWIDTTAALAVEWTEGFSLLEVLRTRRELEPEGVLLLLGQMAEAVDHAVRAGLDRLDFALHQTLIAFREPISAEREAELLRIPVRDWPSFAVKINPLGITRELSMSDTWAGGQTLVGEVASPHSQLVAESSDDEAVRRRYVQALAALGYELLGGTLPAEILRPGPVRPLERYVPISTLPEQGNSVLRKGLDPRVSYPSGAAFFEALRSVDALATRRTGATRRPEGRGSAAGSVSGQSGSGGVAVPLPDAVPPPVPSSKPGPGYLVAIIAVGVLLLAVAVIVPMMRTSARLAGEPTSTPAPTPVSVVVETPLPTPEPTATPVPTPSRQEELKAALVLAESLENEGKWAGATAAYVKIANDYPESDLGRVRLEILLQRLRNEPGGVDGEAFERLREPLEGAAKLGVTSAMVVLGENLRESDPKASFDWLCAAAAQGSPQAFTQVGLMYSNGAGVSRDLERAVWWFEEAGRRGDAAGLTCLGECYLYGKGVPRDPAKAASILQQAVALNDPRAMNLLGTLYQKGVGVAEDFEQARKLFTDAYELGYMNALGNLGVLYINGQGVKQDAKKAVSLFGEGSRAGSDSSMFFFARCLESGTGIGKDAGEAERWYREAAVLGHPGAQAWCRENNVAFE